MFDHRVVELVDSRRARVRRGPHGPDIIRRRVAYGAEAGAEVRRWAGDDRPGGAVVVLGQGGVRSVRCELCTNGPEIASYPGDIAEELSIGVRVLRGDGRPGGPVVVLDQRLHGTAVRLL